MNYVVVCRVSLEVLLLPVQYRQLHSLRIHSQRIPISLLSPHTHTILSLIHLRETVRDLSSGVINYCRDRYRPLIWLRDSSLRICYTLISFWVGSLSRAFRLNQSNANLFIKARTGLLDRWTRFIVIKHEIF
jgi:hypothetical protein